MNETLDIQSPSLSIVIPAYHEELRIRRTIQELDRYLQTRPWICEVIIVVEPSSDLTLQIAREESAKNERIRVIANPVHRGKGFAVKTGILQATGDWVLFMDADLAVSLDQIDGLYERATSGVAEIYVGDRFSKPEWRNRHRSLFRFLFSGTFRKIVLRCIGLHIPDSQCGFKIFKNSVAKEIFSEIKIDGFAFDVELLILAQTNNRKVISLPVRWIDPGNSTFSIVIHGCQVARDILRIQFNGGRWLNAIDSLVPFTLGLIGVAQIWYTLDPMTVDHQGHITSAILFWKGYFHSFVDQFFLGYVQNLFYPPLQDFLLGGMIRLLPFNTEEVYRLYLSLVWISSLLLVAKVSRNFPRIRAKAVFQVGAFFLLINFSEIPIMTDQGLALPDLIIAGLGPQALSAIFFFALLDETLKRINQSETKAPVGYSFRLTLIFFGILVSHLVTAAVAAMIGFWLIILDKKNRLSILLSGLVAFSMSLFFWGPMLMNRSELVVATVHSAPRLGPILFAGFVLIGFYRMIPKTLLLGILIPLVLVLPGVIQALQAAFGLGWKLPNFHYYRLQAYAYWIQLVITCQLLSNLKGWTLKPRFRSLIVILFFGLLIFQKNPLIEIITRFHRPLPSDPYAFRSLVNPSADRFQRTWVKPLDRPISFATDSQLAAIDENFRSPKGLFWESSLTNEFVTNYIGSLDGGPFILENSLYINMRTLEYACVQRSFLEDYAIDQIIAPIPITRMAQERLKVFKDPTPGNLSILSERVIQNNELSERTGIQYLSKRDINIGFENFRLYQVKAKNPERLQVVERLFQPIQFLETPATFEERKPAFIDLVYNRCIAEGHRNSLFLDREGIQFTKNLPASVTDAPAFADTAVKLPKMSKISRNRYRIEADANHSGLYLIKLAYFPFWHLKSAAQKTDSKVYRSWQGMVAEFKGTSELEFKKPKTFYYFYVFSIFSTLLFAWLCWIRKS